MADLQAADESNVFDQQSNNQWFFLTEQDKYHILLTLGIGGIASFLVCMAALGIACKVKLYRYFVHRLAMYQVMAAACNGVICALEMVFINYDRNPEVYHIPCMIVGFLLEYVLWVKLMSIFCLTVNLFCFAVFYVNFKKLEIVYILIMVATPLLFTWIPFIDNIYGQAGAWCWIQNWKNDDADNKTTEGEIEQYALLCIPAMVGLLIASIAVVAILIILICRTYRPACCHRANDEHDPLLGTVQTRKKILQEMLPFVAYPIISALFYTPSLVNRIIGSITKTASYTSFMLSAASLPGLSFFAGVTLIAHILILECPKWYQTRGHAQRDQRPRSKVWLTNVFTADTVASTAALTHWEPPSESVADMQ